MFNKAINRIPPSHSTVALPAVCDSLYTTVVTLLFICNSSQLHVHFRYACDIRVIRLLRDRTLGNSPARLVKQLKENHGEEMLNRLAHYLGECGNFVDRPSLFPVVCQEPPEPIAVPTSSWLLSVYGRDILSRLDHIKASITSTFGSILKMDSTKQVINNLCNRYPCS